MHREFPGASVDVERRGGGRRRGTDLVGGGIPGGEIGDDDGICGIADVGERHVDAVPGGAAEGLGKQVAEAVHPDGEAAQRGAPRCDAAGIRTALVAR